MRLQGAQSSITNTVRSARPNVSAADNPATLPPTIITSNWLSVILKNTKTAQTQKTKIKNLKRILDVHQERVFVEPRILKLEVHVDHFAEHAFEACEIVRLFDVDVGAVDKSFLDVLVCR